MQGGKDFETQGEGKGEKTFFKNLNSDMALSIPVSGTFWAEGSNADMANPKITPCITSSEMVQKRQ